MTDPFAHLETVVKALRAAEVPFALIGGQAMTAMGRPRATLDIDLLTNDRRVLDVATWPAGARVEIRAATDPTDPVDGLVELADLAEDEAETWETPPPAVYPTQVVLLRRPWIDGVLSRATRSFRLGGVEVPVIEPADLALLKVYAGGPRDRDDVFLLAQREDWIARRAEVEARIVQLPRAAQGRWRRWREAIDEEP